MNTWRHMHKGLNMLEYKLCPLDNVSLIFSSVHYERPEACVTKTTSAVQVKVREEDLV